MENDRVMPMVFIISTILLIVILARLFKWLNVYYYKFKHYSSIAHAPVLPIIGNLHQVTFEKDGQSKDISNFSMLFKNEPYFMFWLATEPYLCIHRCDHIEEFFHSSELSHKSRDYEFLHPWLKTGLLTSNGEKWAIRRKLITPSFHFDILKDFLLIMNDQCDIFIEKVKEERSKNKSKIVLKEFIQACALDIICESAMGQHMNAQNNRDSEYTKAVHEMSWLIIQRTKSPWLWSDWIFNISPAGIRQKKCLEILHGFTKRIIKERDENFQGLAHCKNARVAFLDTLLEAKRQNPDIMTNDDIQEEVDTFMFAGHDTSATIINWALYNIAGHPEVQKKIQQEIDDVIGNTNRHLTFEDLNKLEYLECVIKESLRLFPSAPYIGRCIKEDIVINGQKFLKETTVIIQIYMIHRDEKFYPQPERFDPDRFKPETCSKRPSFAYIPFSAGRRNCIGQKFAMMEMKVILANILKNFEIECNQSLEEIGMCFEAILRPINNIIFSLKPR